MSFPSSVDFLKQGMKPEEALLRAFEVDTPLGWRALSGVVDAARHFVESGHINCRLKHIPNHIRGEARGQGVMIDIDPNSETGRQVARLMGTDCARPLISKHFGVYLGFANCCKVLASTRNPADVVFTAAEQIAWQEKPDC